jgi:hypothetical protein
VAFEVNGKLVERDNKSPFSSAKKHHNLHGDILSPKCLHGHRFPPSRVLKNVIYLQNYAFMKKLSGAYRIQCTASNTNSLQSPTAYRNKLSVVCYPFPRECLIIEILLFDFELFADDWSAHHKFRPVSLGYTRWKFDALAAARCLVHKYALNRYSSRDILTSI